MSIAPRLQEIVQDVILGSPYNQLLGTRLVALAPDCATTELPFRPEIVTVGETVHGGAIAALADITAVAAVWSNADAERHQRGATVSLSLAYLAAASASTLTAKAQVLRRGREIIACEVEITDGEGKGIARALVSYKIG
jgi:uncharacterized protein (TIGR00369 family)